MAAPAAAAPAPLRLDRISLRQQERGLVIGGVDSGKSTLCDYLRHEFLERYARRGGRCLMLDSKPRYRAERTVSGASAARRYRHWSHGRPVPGSVVVDDPRDLPLAWQTGARTVIVQGFADDDADVARMVAAAKRFNADSRANRPQLLYVDETLDFYHSNGSPKGGRDSILRAARAGRERGTAVLYGSQRSRGLPRVMLNELARLYILRVDAKNDVKDLYDVGCPKFVMPTKPHVFMYWWKGDYEHIHGPFKLAIAA